MKRFSIITICFNAVNDLRQTLQSVMDQDFEDMEYIVIDGGSHDGTVELLKQYADRITYWSSEPDRGVYDAMNKGLKHASGHYVNYMNAGDTFASANVLTSVNAAINGCPDVVYGATVNAYSWGKILSRPDSLERIGEYMPFCHQSAFVRREVLLSHPFDTRYRICADYNLFYKLYREHATFVEIDVVVAIFEAESGMSNNNFEAYKREHRQITGQRPSLARRTIAWARRTKARLLEGLCTNDESRQQRHIQNLLNNPRNSWYEQ